MIVKWVVVRKQPIFNFTRFYGFFCPFLPILNDFTPKTIIFPVFLFLKILVFLNFHSLP